MRFSPAQLADRVEKTIWGDALGAMPRWKARALRIVRLVVVVARDIALGQLTLRAMSLVYTTLLSFVPLLALAFSVLKAFGVHNQIEPMLGTFLAPLGDQSEEITRRIIEFIGKMNVGVLGSAGLGLLIYTAVSLVQKVEESFNFIWHIGRPRKLGQRFSNYLSVLLVGPLLVFSAIGITATVTSMGMVRDALSVAPIGRLAYELGRLMPYLLIIGAFTFVYKFIPNTRVRLTAALAGGIVGGVLWQSAGWAFSVFIASSTRYAAIYSGFAALILFLIWLYLSWLILLVGASVAFYRQHPQYLIAKSGDPQLSIRMRERLALLIMSRIARHHVHGLPAWSAEQLAREAGVLQHAVEIVIGALQASGILSETNADPPTYLPTRDLAGVSIGSLLHAVRAAGEARYLGPRGMPVPANVEEVLTAVERAITEAAGEKSTRDLGADNPPRQ